MWERKEEAIPDYREIRCTRVRAPKGDSTDGVEEWSPKHTTGLDPIRIPVGSFMVILTSNAA